MRCMRFRITLCYCGYWAITLFGELLLTLAINKPGLLRELL